MLCIAAWQRFIGSISWRFARSVLWYAFLNAFDLGHLLAGNELCCFLCSKSYIYVRRQLSSRTRKCLPHGRFGEIEEMDNSDSTCSESSRHLRRRLLPLLRRTY